MEIPFIAKPKRPSARPRSSEDIELMPEMRRRYSRALGVFGLLKAGLEDRDETSVALAGSYKQDCIDEIVRCVACDEHREFMEREFGMCFRLVLGAHPVLHGSSVIRIGALEKRLLAEQDARQRDHEYSFAIGAIRVAASRFSKRQLKSGRWEAPPIHGNDQLFLELLRLMSDFPARRSIETQVGSKMRFGPPNRIIFVS